MLDLEAEVAGEDVKEPAAAEVGRAEQLAVVPLAAALVLGLLLGELVRAFREVPTEDDRERPEVADQVGGRVAGQGEEEERARERREDDVVLQRLAADLLPDPTEQLALVGERCLAAGQALDFEIVQGHPVLEEQR